MAAGRESLSASRVRVVPRRPFWAVPFNEKEFFYRSRVLRRAQKQAAAADWTGRCPVLVSSEEVAALANRCQQLEWAAAVAHYNVTQLHERVSLLETAGEMPPLPLPVVSPEAEPVEHTVQVMSAPASPESATMMRGARKRWSRKQRALLIHLRPRRPRRRTNPRLSLPSCKTCSQLSRSQS